MLQPFRPLIASSVTRCYSTSSCFAKARVISCENENSLDALKANEPIVFKKSFDSIPAIEKWFIASSNLPRFHELNTAYLERHGDATVPLELTRTSTDKKTSFERFDAPLSLLISYMSGPTDAPIRLYLAQHSLADLPLHLQADLPTPTLLSQLGRGDIYASSLWMGRPPTRTPLHRDPNPNLFVQLAGQKVVRLMRPDAGRQLYEKVRAEVGKVGGRANMRGEEMMEGNEMEALEKAVWGEESEVSANSAGVEAKLSSGDGLYIPLGWWHAVHGVGSGANASVCYSHYYKVFIADLRRSIGGSDENLPPKSIPRHDSNTPS